MKNYLSNRQSIVNFYGKFSTSETLRTGVSQGSILGPLLFTIFINDLCLLVVNSNKTIFADDTTLYLKGSNLQKIACELEKDLEIVAGWLRHNRLLLNVKKSNAMIFKWKYQQNMDVMNTNIDAFEELEIKCGGERIPLVKKFTLFGVLLDEFLTFDMHTIAVCSKVNWKISVLKKSSFLFDLKFRVTLFKLFIMSKYDYCSSLFIHFSDCRNYERLDKNFAKAIKSYLKINIYNHNIEEQLTVLKNYKLIPLKLRFFKNLVFLFSL